MRYFHFLQIKKERICYFPIVLGIFEKIINFYRDDGLALDDDSKKRLDYHGVYNVIGEFFKDAQIKHQLENKVFFTKFDKNPRSKCVNVGYNHYIFPYSDLIEVDSDKGILYCVQLKENIIAPSGEIGSNYCYELRKKKGIL